MINKKRLTMISILVLIFAVVMAVVMTISLPGQFDEEIRRTVSTLENHTASDLTLAIMKLKPKYMEAVLLYFYEGYSMKEIGEMLRITEAAVSGRLLKAKQKLRQTLEGGERDE